MMRANDGDRGRLAKRPSDIPRSGWIDITLRVKNEIAQDNLSMLAAGAAFYGLLALFPSVAAIVSLYGLFTDPQTVAEHIQVLQGIVPDEASSIINDQLLQVTTANEGALGFGAIVAFLLALWSSSKGVKSLMTALNVVYDENEKRGFFRLNVVALLLTVTILFVVLISLAAVAVLPALVDRLGLPPVLEGLLRWLRWPLLAAIAVAATATLYRYAASRARPQWSWVIYGAITATVLWLLGSGLLSWYVSNFGSYNETYGSVAAVVVLMMWFYLSAYFVLVGGEVNAEMEHQTRYDTTAGRPLPMGERGAYVADTLGHGRGDTEMRTG
jgi:membrane protein